MSAVEWVAARIGMLLAVGGGILLLVSLWLPWFEVSRPCPQLAGASCQPLRFNAWESFQQADAALALLAVGAILGAAAGPALGTAAGRALGLEAPLARALAGLAVAGAGWLAVCACLFAIQRPIVGEVPAGGRVPGWGFFLALVAGGAIVAGGWWPALAGSNQRR